MSSVIPATESPFITHYKPHLFSPCQSRNELLQILILIFLFSTILMDPSQFNFLNIWNSIFSYKAHITTQRELFYHFISSPWEEKFLPVIILALWHCNNIFLIRIQYLWNYYCQLFSQYDHIDLSVLYLRQLRMHLPRLTWKARIPFWAQTGTDEWL